MSITENAWPLVFAFVLAATVCAHQWSQKRQAAWIVAAGVLYFLGVGTWGIDHIVVTPREAVRATVKQIVEDFRAKREAEVMDAISATAPNIQKAAKWGLGYITLKDNRVLFEQVEAEGERKVKCRFRVNGEIEIGKGDGAAHVASYWESVWTLEGDRWRMTSLTELNPKTGQVQSPSHVSQ